MLARLQASRRAYHERYYAMFSSILGGIVTDPTLMVLPLDDHMVHRGDGVFEVVKCTDGNLYNWLAHLSRLEASAAGIGLRSAWSPAELTAILGETVRAGGRRDCLARLFLSRGPGSQSVNPYDSPAPALYVVAYQKNRAYMDAHPEGTRAVTNLTPVKPGAFARIKSLNYLPNVLMKKAAVDAGVDFALGFDENGFLAEGATENAGIVTRDRVLRVPRPDRILRGTTMMRVLELARGAEGRRDVRGCEEGDIAKKDLSEAAEILIFGTTADVTAVVELDGRPVGDGRPGPVFLALRRLLLEDIRSNAALHTPAFVSRCK